MSEGPAAPAGPGGGRRFPIRVGGLNRVLFTVLGMGPRVSYVEIVDDTTLAVRMGIGFRARLHRRSIVDAGVLGRYVWWAYGVHLYGRKTWIVNGSGHGIVKLRFDPLERGRVMGVPVRLRELWVSLEDPDGFLAAIGR